MMEFSLTVWSRMISGREVSFRCPCSVDGVDSDSTTKAHGTATELAKETAAWTPQNQAPS